MKKVLFICVTMLLICISGKATERNLLLIPYPQQVSIKQGNYNLTDNVKIGADPLFTQELKKLQRSHRCQRCRKVYLFTNPVRTAGTDQW